MEPSKIKRELARLCLQAAANFPGFFTPSLRGNIKKLWNRLQYEEGLVAAELPLPRGDRAAPLDLSMTSGFGETVHPGVLYVPEGFGAEKWKYLMTVTPFPKAIVYFENPEFLVSHDGLAWSLPPGGASPVVPPPSDWTGYNSDPALFFEDGRIFIFYREVREEKNSLLVTLFVISSDDGVRWSAPAAVRAEKVPPDRAGVLMSPSVLKIKGRYFMWYVGEEDGAYKIRRAECPRLSLTAEGDEADVSGMPGGFQPWHIDIAEDGGRLLMALCVKDVRGSHSLIFAESFDCGLKWRVLKDKLIAPKKENGEASLYKAALAKGAQGRWKLYYSYRDVRGHWYTVAEEIDL